MTQKPKPPTVHDGPIIARLVIDITYDDDGLDANEEIKQTLENFVAFGVDNGLLSEGLERTVKSHDYFVNFRPLDKKGAGR